MSDFNLMRAAHSCVGGARDVFFFQAEDGIRDSSVTGVQTCALPICNIYVSSAGDSAIAVFSRNVSTGRLTFVEAQFDGVNGVTGLRGAAAVRVSPDGGEIGRASCRERV